MKSLSSETVVFSNDSDEGLIPQLAISMNPDLINIEKNDSAKLHESSYASRNS